MSKVIITETIIEVAPEPPTTSNPTKFTKIDIADIKHRLSEMKYKIKEIFGVALNGYTATHLLVTTPQNQEALLIIPWVECEECIVCTELPASIVPMSIVQFFKENLAGEKFCFLSHLGIDTLGDKSGNFAFDGTERTLQKIGKGMKFYEALPLVVFEELVPDTERNTIQTYIGNSTDTTLFREIVDKAKLSGLINSEGPYTVFAPSNSAIIRRFGKNYELLTEKGNDYMKSFVLSHIVPGIYDENFTGTVINMNEDEVKIVAGKVESVTEILESKCKYNGKVCVMKNVIEPKTMLVDYTPAISKHTTSMMDISLLTYKIWKTHNLYNQTLLAKIETEVSMILEKVNEFKAETAKLEKVGNSILKIDGMYRDKLHEHEKDGELDVGSLNSRLVQLTEQYEKHIDTSAKILAAEQILAIIAKLFRDA